MVEKIGKEMQIGIVSECVCVVLAWVSWNALIAQ